MEGEAKIEVVNEATATAPPTSNVIKLYPAQPREQRIPQLTGKEILALRKMLEDFDAIKGSCPLAQRALAK